MPHPTKEVSLNSHALDVLLSNGTFLLPLVLSNKIDRAHNKLQKWDQMANKITELSEQKQQKAREKEVKLQKKLEQAQKQKEE